MAVAAMLTHRTEGLPELEVGYARVGESRVRRPGVAFPGHVARLVALDERRYRAGNARGRATHCLGAR